MQKQLMRQLLSQTVTDSLTVTYWDGTTEQYGNGNSSCRVILNDCLDPKKVMSDPIMALGEAYMDGNIEVVGDLSKVIKLAFLNQNSFLQRHPTVKKALSHWQRPNSLTKQKKDIHHHYDLGNDFFSLWLDETMSYSCAYFDSPKDSLYQAQLQKIDHILKKMQLRPGETLLDIGSGWGWLIIRAAQQYQVKALGITLSEQQYVETKRRIAELGLSELVEVELMDYRELAESGRTFDKVVSVGMLEHVGKAYLPKYMMSVDKLLVPRGISLLHTITHLKEGPVNGWIEKHIFPGGYIPSLRELVGLLPKHDFHLLDAESLRLHYAMTLDHWAENFEQNVETVEKRYGQRFVRMWRLYLQSCAASFRYNGLNIHQLLFSKGLNNDLPLTRKHLYAEKI